MRKILITICTAVLVKGGVYSQIIDGDFENFVFTGGDCIQNFGPALTTNASPFVACDFAGWLASHGSPEVFNNGVNRSATMWSGRWNDETPIRGEGIHAYCYFTKGKTYHLTLQLACSGTDATIIPAMDNFISNVYIKLGNNVPILGVVSYAPTSIYYDIPTVTNTQTIFHYNNFNSQVWQNIDFYFVPDNDYNSLWIYPEHSNGPSTISVLFVDNVSIEDCIPDVTYSNTTNLPSYTLRRDYIAAINNTQVLSGQHVTFNAGDHIYLGPNFSANYGSDFAAYISGCEASNCTNPFKSTNANLPDNNFSGIRIFPNPNSGEFTVSIKSMVNSAPNLYIMDLSGRIIHSQLISIYEGLNQISISKPELTSGIYFIKVDGFDETLKIIITH